MWNPDKAKDTQFKTDRVEPCTAQVSVRIPPSLKAQLKSVNNWQELVRQTLQKAVQERSA